MATSTASAQTPSGRPHILGIQGVSIFVSDTAAARSFYQDLIDPEHACNFCEKAPIPYFFLSGGQHIALKQLSSSSAMNLLGEVSFRTDDLEKLEEFLRVNGVVAEEKGAKDKKRGRFVLLNLLVRDPEGHQISFVGPAQPFYNQSFTPDLDAANLEPRNSRHIIHAGFIVHDRPAMEHFYKDILGFRPYWHGGRKDDGVDDWVSFQVPDGTGWIEFMLNVPDNADKHLRGVMNHIALGVTDVQATKEQLIKNGVTLTQEPKIGRDGKWQLNVYDPDDTRIEFMEFTPKGKTCCSEFTAPHPKP